MYCVRFLNLPNMKKAIVFSVFFLLAIIGFSQQPNMKAKLRSRTLASESLPVDSLVQLELTNHDLRRGKFRFSYKNELNDADVKRSFAIQDSTGKPVYSAEGSSFKIPAKKLRELLQHSSLNIYTMAIPADPEKAKIVRVRPVQIAQVRLR